VLIYGRPMTGGGSEPTDGGDLGGAGATGAMPDGRRSVLWGRLVTYGLVLGLLVGAWTHTEHWPVTSFRLFSSVRTDRSFGLELVAVGPNGERERIPASAGEGATVGSIHQLTDLRNAPPAVRRERVLSMMERAGLDVADYRVAQLERVERRLDPDGGPSTEVARTVVRTVELG